VNSIRIWYQSFVDYANGKTYWDRLRAHLAQIADPGTVIAKIDDSKLRVAVSERWDVLRHKSQP
jgi:hypothetical protein